MLKFILGALVMSTVVGGFLALILLLVGADILTIKAVFGGTFVISFIAGLWHEVDHALKGGINET